MKLRDEINEIERKKERKQYNESMRQELILWEKSQNWKMSFQINQTSERIYKLKNEKSKRGHKLDMEQI